ncbi:MAG: 4'-phosphopantetheinyl transferase superfamily protein [Streptosporangiaceae bacterium]|jgi:4'-phosphopantetheinyl transferase
MADQDRVQVWLIRTDPPDPVLADLAVLLDEAERERARTLAHPVSRRRFIAAHGAVRLVLGDCLGAPPASLRWRYGPHGKPGIAGTGVQVSLSHSGDLAALAIADRRRVGIDVQRVLTGLAATTMAARYYPPAEARFVMAAGGRTAQADCFTRLWARKEACLKVTGGRLLPGLAQSVMDTGLAGGYQAATALIRELPVPPGYRAAVAAEGTARYRITRRWWAADLPDWRGNEEIQHSLNDAINRLA